jgi:hypothetical protein
MTIKHIDDLFNARFFELEDVLDENEIDALYNLKHRKSNTAQIILLHIIRSRLMKIIGYLNNDSVISNQTFHSWSNLFPELPHLRWYYLLEVASAFNIDRSSNDWLNLIRHYTKVIATKECFIKDLISENFKTAIERSEDGSTAVITTLKRLGVIDDNDVVQPFFEEEGYAKIEGQGKLIDTHLTAFGELFLQGVEISSGNSEELPFLSNQLNKNSVN